MNIKTDSAETLPATLAPDPAFSQNSHVNLEQYRALYAASIADPDAFWGEQGKRLDWIKPYSKVKDVDFTLGSVKIKWFEDGVLNVSANRNMGQDVASHDHGGTDVIGSK